jgi:hypothetical protein
MNTRIARFPGEHRYYIAAAVGVAIIIVAGFTPNYVLRILHDKRFLTPLVHFHGLVMASWIALFVAQVVLAARRRTDLHRRLGAIGAWLIVPMLLIGGPVLFHAAARQAHGDTMRFYLMLIGFDGLNLLLFACLAACAVLLRHRSDYHKRLMLLATLSLLPPAFGRLTEYAGFRGGNHLAILLLMLACVCVCVATDVRRQHRWHPVFVWGAAALVTADALTYVANLSL